MLSFARTKIQPPRARPGALLARAALQDRLVDALSSMPLVLVCATAGFGKTSALTQAIEALQANGTAVAWVGCDEGDRHCNSSIAWSPPSNPMTCPGAPRPSR